nr:prolyl oligopeptidase family serine peptidase [Jongsikchunia kroppenstedtii]
MQQTPGAQQTPGEQQTPDDPYLWLEDVTGDEALDWVRAHNQLTLQRLATGDRFDELNAGALEVLDTDARIPYPRRRGEYLYNFWRDAEHPRGLWRRTTPESYATDAPEWDVLIDLDRVAADEDENWVWKSAQTLRERPGPGRPVCRRALISLSRGGADAAVVREFDLETWSWVPAPEGFVLPENKSGVDWIDRDTIYVGSDFGPDADGIPTVTDSGYPRVAKRWRRGTALADAETVFAGSVDDVSVSVSYDDTPGFERHFLDRATDFYNAESYELRYGPNGVEQVRIDVPTDSLSIVHHDRLYVLTKSAWDAGESAYDAGTLAVFDYSSFLTGDRTGTVLFTPDAHTSLESFSFTRSHLVLVTLRDVRTELTLLRLDDWSPHPVAGLPELSTVSVIGTDSEFSDELFLTASGYTQPTSLYYGDTATGVRPLKSLPSFFDATNVTATQHFATSADGTRIPYFVVKRDDVAAGPTLLYGYGGFEVSLTPDYSAIAGRSWISRGGIYVVANIRGGGEYGPDWHTQTQLAGRHLVYEDFAAVARALVADGLTTPEQLAAQGGSNGGLLMGVMYTSYPELFGALVCQVPLLDMRRYHRLLAGASWMAEYGDPDDPDQWEFISTYSPYQRITPAQPDHPRPPLLMTTSTRDDRVHPGHARKFVARLEDSGQRHDHREPGVSTVDYYENIEGGHGGAADNKQSAFKSALAYEFLWRTVGAVGRAG